MIRAVLDANVVVSGILSQKGIPGKLFGLGVSNGSSW